MDISRPLKNSKLGATAGRPQMSRLHLYPSLINDNALLILDKLIPWNTADAAFVRP
jgi:hypothetical protein